MLKNGLCRNAKRNALRLVRKECKEFTPASCTFAGEGRAEGETLFAYDLRFTYALKWGFDFLKAWERLVQEKMAVYLRRVQEGDWKGYPSTAHWPDWDERAAFDQMVTELVKVVAPEDLLLDETGRKLLRTRYVCRKYI